MEFLYKSTHSPDAPSVCVKIHPDFLQLARLKRPFHALPCKILLILPLLLQKSIPMHTNHSLFLQVALLSYSPTEICSPYTDSLFYTFPAFAIYALFFHFLLRKMVFHANHFLLKAINHCLKLLPSHHLEQIQENRCNH